MSDVEISIGADASSATTTLDRFQAHAATVGKKVGESLGLEGLKGERGLKVQTEGFFKDIAAGADPATAAMGRLSESFRMTGGAVVATAAIGFLAETLTKGYENAEKFRGAVKDALTISDDNSSKSVEQLGEEISKLKEDAKATDLGAMSGLEAGATVVLQSLTEMKSVGEVVKDDIMEHAEIAAKAHREEDEAAGRSIRQENEILQLKLSGNDEAASQRADELADANKLLELERQKDEGAIAALREQIELKGQLREKEGRDKSAKATKEVEGKAQDKIEATNKQASDAERKAVFDALPLAGKIAELQKRIVDAEALRKNVNASAQQKADLRLVIAQSKDQLNPLTRERDTQAKTEQEKKQAGADKMADLLVRKRSSQAEIDSAQANALGFHGQADSLRHSGFAGRVGPNENGAQLKAIAEGNKHLSGVLKEITALNNKLHVAGE